MITEELGSVSEESVVELPEAPAAAAAPPSDEEVRAAQLEFTSLLARNPAVLAAVNMSVVGRQLYNMGLSVLERTLESCEAVHPDLAMRMARFTAERVARDEYTLAKIQARLTGSALPLLAEEIDRARAEQRKQARDAERAAKVSLKKQAVPIGFRWNNDEEMSLPRDETLVIFGEPAAVEALGRLSLLAAAGTSQGGFAPVVFWLDRLPYAARDESGADKHRLVRVGIEEWLNKGGSREKLEEFLSRWQRTTRRHRCDLLLIDDIRQLKAEIDYASESARINAAQWALHRWAEDRSAATLAFVPVQTIPELDKPLEDMARHVAVRFVRTRVVEGDPEASASSSETETVRLIEMWAAGQSPEEAYVVASIKEVWN